MTVEDIPIAMPPEDVTDFSSFSMPLGMSLSMSIPDFGEDGVGDQWWLKSSMSYGDYLMTETEEQDFTIFSVPTDDIKVPIEDAFDVLSLPVHAASISMSMIAIPPEAKIDFLSFSMPLEASLDLSISDFSEEGVGDWWWLKSSMWHRPRICLI